MRDLKDLENEYFEGNFTSEEPDYNRNRVDRMKKFIVASFIVMCSIPVFFCLYLMVKMNNMQSRIDVLNEKLSVKGQVEMMAERTESTEIVSEQDKSLLEQGAVNSLDKTPGEDNNILMESNQDVEGGVEDISVADEEPTTESASMSVNSKHKVYLTFDDGPSIHTEQILDILKENDVKATFFVVYTPNKELWPLYKRIVDEGHTLAMHSYTHVYEDVYSSEGAFVEDVTLIHDFLYQQTGVDCKYYRFPGGSSNSVSSVDIQDLMGYLYESGITYYDWNALSEDAVDLSLSPEELNENIMESVRNNNSNSIVLMHDLRDNPNTAAGLQDLIDTLKEEGYQICPIDDNTIPVQHVTYEGE